MRRIVVLLIAMAAALIVASGVAFAVIKDCQPDIKCVGTPQTDVLTGTSGSDRIYGLAKGDTLYGLGEGDRLVGGGGADDLRGGYVPNTTATDDGANDTLSGSGGSDTYIFGNGWGADTVIDEAIVDETPATGNRVYLLTTTTGNMAITLESDSGPLPEVRNGTNTINWDGNVIDNVNVSLGSSNDTITGNSRANFIATYAGGGNDNISGGGGDDSINVGDRAGNDTVDCGDGNDKVSFDAGDKVSNCENQNRQ
jgi:Ca2+-binding RTX toxin-like protein